MRLAFACLILVVPALAKPPAPGVLCATWPEAPTCDGGVPGCELCHTTAPTRNRYGAQLEDALLPDVPRPLDDEDFAAGLPEALGAVAELDADGDGHTNAEELRLGSLPADETSTPRDGDCSAAATGEWNLCGQDLRLAFKRVMLDFCGRSPTWESWTEYGELGEGEQRDRLHAVLDECLESAWWRGADGVLWRLAHPKVKPIQAVKSGRDAGVIPLGDYDDDYRLFVWAHTDDHDARDLLLADYFVEQDLLGGGLRRVDGRAGQQVVAERRAGMLTTRWFLLSNNMFTAIPRTSAAVAYKAYLGYDIGRMEGLQPAVEIPQDYDDRGVREPACAACHTTLDPLSYPFSRYRGLEGRASTYEPNRMNSFRDLSERILETPEAGVLFGQAVADLNEWAEVAANSDAFARSVVQDFWRVLLGHDPQPDEAGEFNALWRAFRGEHAYRTERMLHALIETEAYGAP